MLANLLRRSPVKNTAAVRTFTRSSIFRNSPKMEKVDTSARLSHLRELMKQHKVDIYGILSHTTPHSITY